MARKFRILPVLALLPAFVPWGSVFAQDPDSSGGWKCPATAGKHQAKICECLEARLPNGKGASSIQDFICPESLMGDYDVAYRVVLDLEFKEIDKQADGKLKEMQSRGGTDFDKMSPVIANWFDESSPDREFHKKYSGICSDLADPLSVLGQTIESLKSVDSDGSTATFAGNKQACQALVSKKLQAYSKAANLFMYQNIADANKSDKKDFVDKLKDLYKKFIWKWTIYLGELGRINSKWNEFTKTVN